MGLLNWIFDFYQQSRIEDMRRNLEQANLEAARIRASGGGIDAARLEAAIGELALAVKTLQRVAVEKGLCTRGELERAMERIDLEDGRADGRAPAGGLGS